MKNGFWDRVLIFLYVLLTVALVALLGLQVFGIDLINPFYENLAAQAEGIVWKLIVCGIGAIVVLLGIFVLATVLPGKKAQRDFITITNDENGQVRIALPALREMATQAVGDAAGLKEMDVDISDAGDAITVGISLDIVSGTHVPTLTMNMQRAVRTYIQTNCGVAVKEVSVVINSMLPAPVVEKAAPTPVDLPVAVPAPVEIPEEAIEREVIFEPTILPDEALAAVEDREEAEEAAGEKAE